MCDKRGYLLNFFDETHYIDTLIYIVTLSILSNVTPVTLISENNKARILNTLFRVKLLALVQQVVALLKTQLSRSIFFGGNFQTTVLPIFC